MRTRNLAGSFKSETKVLDYTIYGYREVSSTNIVAKKIARSSEFCQEKTVVMAETQTSGRGRLGRKWFSPKGGLWLSIILHPEISPTEALRLSLMSSLSVAKTLKLLYNIRTEVKWPNDVLVNGKKICGILAETSTSGVTVEFAIIGVGINANIRIEAFPSHVRETATSLSHELGCRIDLTELAEAFLKNFNEHYRLLQKNAWADLLDEWKKAAAFLGRSVEIESAKEHFVGTALDVNKKGALIVKLENGVEKEIVTGSVVLRRKH